MNDMRIIHNNIKYQDKSLFGSYSMNLNTSFSSSFIQHLFPHPSYKLKSFLEVCTKCRYQNDTELSGILTVNNRVVENERDGREGIQCKN